MSKVELIGLHLPDIKEGDDISELIINYCIREKIVLDNGDIIALTSKILSKSLGLLYRIDDIKPSQKAITIARKAGGDPRFIELILRESDEIIAAIPLRELVVKGIVKHDILSKDVKKLYNILNKYPTLFITQRDGLIWTDSGIDSSNHPPGIASVPPRNLDDHARTLSWKIRRRMGVRVAVVICDTEVFPSGTIDIARGSYGVPVTARRFGEPDMYGKPKYGGADSIANEVCASAGLIMGQHGEGIPVVVIKGLSYDWDESGVKRVIESIDLSKAIRESVKHTIRILGVKRFLKLLLGR